MWKSYSGNGVDGGRKNVTELRELNRDTARAPAIKATEFHCIKIGAGWDGQRQVDEGDDNEGGRGRLVGSVTMHPKGPTATTSLQGSLKISKLLRTANVKKSRFLFMFGRSEIHLVHSARST